VSVHILVTYWDPLLRKPVREDFTGSGVISTANERVHELRKIYPDNHIGMAFWNPDYDEPGRPYRMPCPKPPFRRDR